MTEYLKYNSMPEASHLPRRSLLHATCGRPLQARACRQKLLEAAAKLERVEHIFAVASDDIDSIQQLADLNPRVFERMGGGCVAPWNLVAHHLACQNDRIMVDGRPLLIFHIHGPRQRALSLFDPQLLRYGVQPDELLTGRIYLPYQRKLMALAPEAGLRKERPE